MGARWPITRTHGRQPGRHRDQYWQREHASSRMAVHRTCRKSVLPTGCRQRNRLLRLRGAGQPDLPPGRGKPRHWSAPLAADTNWVRISAARPFRISGVRADQQRLVRILRGRRISLVEQREHRQQYLPPWERGRRWRDPLRLHGRYPLRGRCPNGCREMEPARPVFCFADVAIDDGRVYATSRSIRPRRPTKKVRCGRSTSRPGPFCGPGPRR